MKAVPRLLFLLAAALVAALPAPAQAGNTSTLPAGMFLLDGGFIRAETRVRWDDHRRERPLIEGIDRYEPGGGLQGTITADPRVEYDFLATQLMYGVTDDLTLAVAVPIIAETRIDPRLGWKSGVYQPSLGRPYSENDFWAWAKSMGQQRPGAFVGNRWTPADLVLGGRWHLPPFAWLQERGLEAAVSAQVALPTGKTPDPEELVAAGTTVWDLHNYGDFELHFALEKPWRDAAGIVRLNAGFDVYWSMLRERTFRTPTGVAHPLLLTHAPYVGASYTVDPGDMLGATLLFEMVPIVGPSWGTWLAGGKRATAAKFPPLLTLSFAHTYAHLNQTHWRSQSRLWSWDREKLWLPGDKNTVKLNAEVTLLRLGLPLQLYGGYRSQEWVPGRNSRASNVLTLGGRVFLKFW